MRVIAAMSVSGRIKQLEGWITESKYAYYNSGRNAVINGKEVTDAMFDAWEDELRKLSPSSKVLKNVGAPTAAKKVPLPYVMFSLDKIKPEGAQVEAWTTAVKGNYVVSDKLDGTALEVVYTEHGIKCYTRGNGLIGQDVSFLAPHLKLPAKCPYTAIRCEAVMPDAKFKAIWAEEFKNARNMVNGLLNRKDVHEGIKDIKVIVHDVLEPRGVPSKQLDKLKSAGFEVVWHDVYSSLDANTLSKLLTLRKQRSKYVIDGLVVAQDKAHRLAPGNPDHKIAFKQTLAEDAVDAKVVQVEWNASKHGYMKPRIEIEPVELDGVTVTWASGFNGKYINDNVIGPGAVINLVRSGGVIPDIQYVTKPARKPKLPAGKWHWSDTGVDIILDDIDTDDVLIRKLENFFATIGAENIGRGVLSKLIDAGYDTPTKIIQMTPLKWSRLPGFQGVMANKLHNSLSSALSGIELATLADATGFFGRGFGTRRFTAVQQEYPNIRALGLLALPMILKKVSAIHGFSDTTAQAFADGIKPFMKWFDRNSQYITIKRKAKATSSKLAGVSVAFTGFRDAELSERIRKAGGVASDNFTATTTILLATNPNSGSSKIQRALDKGVKVMTPTQFISKYGV